jgi:sugar-specific transcriptional regulator TrmB
LIINAVDTLDLQKRLGELGLSTEEGKIIVAIGKLGESKITDISQLTTIPRSSVYRYVDIMEKKGLVKKILTTQGNKIILSNFSTLKNQIAEKKVVLDKQLTGLDEIINSINSFGTLAKTNPEIKYYEGKEGVRQLIWNTLQAKNTIRCYTNATRKDIVGEKWLTEYCLDFCNKGLNEKVLDDKIYSENSYQKFGGRKGYYSPIVEFLKRSDERILNVPYFKIKGEIYMYNDIFSFYTWESSKLIGAEIKSEFMSITQSSIFDVLWGMTTKKDNIDNIIF